ncbi:MAG TPA: hypothetical protein VF678_16575 [bacterium]
MNTHGLRRWIAALTALAGLTLMGCSQERPQQPVALVVPTTLGVTTVDTAGVYAATRQHLELAGLKADRAKSNAEKFTFVSEPVRCSPNSDARHVAMCVISASAGPSAANPQQVAVEVRVRAGALVKYEDGAMQVRLEPVLDGLVTALRGKYAFADVTQTGTVTF